MPEPGEVFGDADLCPDPLEGGPGAALAAEVSGRLAGSNFAANWGASASSAR